MESQDFQGGVCDTSAVEHGPGPFITNVPRAARENQNFRTAFWTGCHLQMTLMCIPPCGEIGPEMHADTDQFIRVECGQAVVCMGGRKDALDVQCCLCPGDGVFVPAGAWHNIRSTGNCPLKLSSIYAPPHHPRGTIHRTRAEAMQRAD